MNLFIWGAFGRVASDRAHLTFFDTGKADAALLELPSGEVCLIDGASARRGHGRRVVGEYLRRQGIRQVDWIFLSHAHEDHIGGLFHIKENFRVGKVSGDAEEDAVRSLLRYSGMLDCDILKVLHHGQKIAEENVLGLFIEMVCPVKVVVLNAAGGRLDETLIHELERSGACLHITGVDGVYIK